MYTMKILVHERHLKSGQREAISAKRMSIVLCTYCKQ